MTEVDLVLFVILGLFTILGLYWGIIRQVLAVVGFIVGFMLAGQYGNEVAVWLGSFITDPNLARIGLYCCVASGKRHCQFACIVVAFTGGAGLLGMARSSAGCAAGVSPGIACRHSTADRSGGLSR